MKIELKKIKFFEAMSEETNAFIADVYVNGKKVAYAKNDGQGGSTFYHAYENMRELLNEAEKYCLGLPKVTYYGMEHSMDLEFKIDLLFEEWLKEKDQTKINKKLEKDMLKGLCFKKGDGYVLTSWKGYTLKALLGIPHGKEAIKEAIKRQKTNGFELLNKNIPSELLAD